MQPTDHHFFYRFGKGETSGLKIVKEDRAKVLGGKGKSLVEMTELGMNVPPGFTIPTIVCNLYRSASDKEGFLKNVVDEALGHYAWLKEVMGYWPMVSVRSGAPVSMPGMMDTILNVGFEYMSFVDWTKKIGERAALDSYRRLIQMLGHTAYGIPAEAFEFQLAKARKAAGVKTDAELDVKQINSVCLDFMEVFFQNTKQQFDKLSLYDQLTASIKAVFDSWMNPRAVEYRKLNNISEDMGTAVTIQCMVFGNMGDDSGSGVAFTRDPSTGQNVYMGEYLVNAQGEDVVAGIRTPMPLVAHVTKEQMAAKDYKAPAPICYYPPDPTIPAFKNGSTSGHSIWAANLMDVFDKLEAHYNDMVDIEFTVQKGELFILQSRVGKRSAAAAFKIAVDMANAGKITREQALGRLTKEQFKIVRKPSIDPNFKEKPHLVGLAACPGVVTGKPVFSSEEAVASTVPCILVTHETTPDDIAGMAKAVGILTQTGGATSHAAVVARAMDKPCIVGCTDMDMVAMMKAAGHADHKITIDGGTGHVWLGINVPVIDSSDSAEVRQVREWCMQQSGWVYQTVVDLDEPVPHHIMAAAWWGDTDVLEAVLDSLCQKPSREHIVLDCSSPDLLQAVDDLALQDCFGTTVEHHEFNAEIVVAICGKKGLHGLTIKGLPLNKTEKLEFGMLGIKFYDPQEPAKTMQDVINGKGDLSPQLIGQIIGDEATYNLLKKLVKDAGLLKQVMVSKAAPADYAVFTCLAAAG